MTLKEKERERRTLKNNAAHRFIYFINAKQGETKK